MCVLVFLETPLFIQTILLTMLEGTMDPVIIVELETPINPEGILVLEENVSVRQCFNS